MGILFLQFEASRHRSTNVRTSDIERRIGYARAMYLYTALQGYASTSVGEHPSYNARQLVSILVIMPVSRSYDHDDTVRCFQLQR